LARFNPDGSPDQTFGFHGAVTNVFDLAGSNVFLPGGESVNAVAVRPDGKIVVAGSAIDPESLSTSFAVEQFNRDGSPDLNFASHGIALWGTADGFFNVLNATSLVLQPSGDIVVAGSEQTDLFGINSLGIIRLRPNGTFDPSFGSNGVVTANTNSIALLQFTPVLLAQEPGGDIVAEGTFSVSPGGFLGQIVLAEYTAGSADPDPAAGLASPSAAILGRAGGSLGLGGAAIAQPAAARSGTRSAALFALVSGATNNVPFNQEGSSLERTDASLPAAQSPSRTVVGSTSVTSRPVPPPALSNSQLGAFFATRPEASPHAASKPDSGVPDVLEPTALDTLFAALV
jgi:uncharacterized delta-60 repeat protein